MEEGCGPVSLRERGQEEVTGALRRKRTEARFAKSGKVGGSGAWGLREGRQSRQVERVLACQG